MREDGAASPSVAAKASAFSYRESKGSMKFVLTFLDLHCACKGLCDELCVVSVCPSSEPQNPEAKLSMKMKLWGETVIATFQTLV